MRASGLRSVGRLCRSLVYAQLLGAALRVSSARVVTSDQSGRFMSHPNRGAMAKEPELSSVPQIIHQSWKSQELPERFQKWSETWKNTHPQWTYRLWTDDDNRNLVLAHYPWFLDTFDALGTPIQRADASRLLYMHAYGGMYADLDFEALKNIEPLLRGGGVFLAAMGKDESFVHSLPNAWMASVKGHPFWLICMQQVIKYSAKLGPKGDAEHITGPGMLHGSVELYRKIFAGEKSLDLKVLPAGAIYPLDWRSIKDKDSDLAKEHDYSVCAVNAPSFNPEKCKNYFPAAFAITWWTHSWGGLP